ncbi:MAG: cyclic nucleotide-binding domain-containing protein [Chlorobi bacterium]|nr:cyclic nucleotide-binding domain-containing protein [Chlorobiota bacterium]
MDINSPKHIEFLKQVSIFKTLRGDELSVVIKYLTLKEVGENDFVFSRFEKEQALYIVRYGKLNLDLAGGKSRMYGKGEVFGEIGLINNNFRSGTIKTLEPTLLLCLNRNDLMNDRRIPASIAMKIVVELANIIATYLATVENTSTARLIEQGENDYVEFKSTLRYNLYTKKFDKEIEHATLKTVAAFLNSAGGTLLIGVDDDKNVLGLDIDKFPDDDKTMLHFTKLVEDRIGMQYAGYLNSCVEGINGGKVLRIDVKPSKTPAYLTHGNNEKLYVRSGPSTSQMKVSEIYDYIQSRFH